MAMPVGSATACGPERPLVCICLAAAGAAKPVAGTLAGRRPRSGLWPDYPVLLADAGWGHNSGPSTGPQTRVPRSLRSPTRARCAARRGPLIARPAHRPRALRHSGARRGVACHRWCHKAGSGPRGQGMKTSASSSAAGAGRGAQRPGRTCLRACTQARVVRPSRVREQRRAVGSPEPTAMSPWPRGPHPALPLRSTQAVQRPPLPLTQEPPR